jgi:nitronate monooxygenase
LLGPYYREYGIDAASIPSGAGRMPFDANSASLIEQFRPAIVSFHFGLPEAALLNRAKATGAAILASATTVEEARWLEAHGADAIIAQGVEAGGHRGMFLTNDISTQVGTFALLPQIVRATQLPVIAAGGIADAQGVAAALRLGAIAAQIGTAYLLTPEATTSAVHRAALTAVPARDTAITNVFSGRPARGIVNRIMRELGPMQPLVNQFPLAPADIAPLRSAAEARQLDDFSPMWCGQNTSGCKPIGAAELTRLLATSA